MTNPNQCPAAEEMKALRQRLREEIPQASQVMVDYQFGGELWDSHSEFPRVIWWAYAAIANRSCQEFGKTFDEAVAKLKRETEKECAEALARSRKLEAARKSVMTCGCSLDEAEAGHLEGCHVPVILAAWPELVAEERASIQHSKDMEKAAQCSPA